MAGRTGSSGLSRRRLLQASGAALLSQAASARAFSQLIERPQLRFGDAHAHLFNLADLPARGFFEHGVLWNTQLSYWPLRHLWLAMLDLIEYLKSRTVGAEQELAELRRNSGHPKEITRDQFRKLAYGRIARMAARRGTLPEPQRHLRKSYRLLRNVIGLVSNPDKDLDQGEAQDGPYLADTDIDRIHSGSSPRFRSNCPEATPSAGGGVSLRAMVEAYLEWAREMMQSRHYHLAQHRNRIRHEGTSASTIVNLLVDFDSWVGDKPAASSGHEAQIRLWQRLRAEYRPQLDLRTFAGFDPLRDAEEWVRLGERYQVESRFDRLQRDISAHAVHGFKLYPPMGFRPLGNEREMFVGKRRALGVVRSRWAELGLDYQELPRRLEGALIRFYRYCAANRVPIMAHAFHSNDASQCAAAYAGPAGWLRVLEGFPDLTVCLAHFAEGVDFPRGMKLLHEGKPIPARMWPLRGTEQLLKLNRLGRSRVYVDISDMPELLHPAEGADRAGAFFIHLRDYCDRYDPGCRHIMFGSDWIMLDRTPGHEIYVKRVLEGMAEARWPEAWQRNLLHDNLQRFLRLRDWS